MNILQAYIKYYKQFIVLIIGLPCTNKSKIAKELVNDLKIPIININHYLIKDKYVEREVDNIKFKLYENDQNYDWEKLNDDISNIKTNGLILYGNYINKDKINFKIDFIFFINMNIYLCTEKLIEKKLLEYEDKSKIDIYINKILNPLYKELSLSLKEDINKYINIKKETSFDEVYDKIFDILMNLIKNSKLLLNK